VILDAQEAPLYLRIAQQASHLRQLGLSNAAIARHLGVDDKTVAKAIRKPLRHDRENHFRQPDSEREE